jgi:catechol 2,3-dioxygenase-like lactoylglutathione lyase family enzyme
MKFNKLIPELSVKDFYKSKEFYLEILGFELAYERLEDQFAFISLNGAQMMIEQCNGHWETSELEYPYGRGINFQIEVENIEVILQNLKNHNISLFRDAMINNYSGFTQKEFIVQDPDGCLLRFSQAYSIQ